MGRITKKHASKGINAGMIPTQGKGFLAKAPTKPSATAVNTRIRAILPAHFRFWRSKFENRVIIEDLLRLHVFRAGNLPLLYTEKPMSQAQDFTERGRFSHCERIAMSRVQKHPQRSVLTSKKSARHRKDIRPNPGADASL
jgi:hypothetical protein